MVFAVRRQWLLAAVAQGGLAGWASLGGLGGLAQAGSLGGPAQAVGRLGSAGGVAAVAGPRVQPGTVLRFPLDHGAHPDFRTEWWYATGAVQTPAGEALGFQVTFFRSRVGAPAARAAPAAPAPAAAPPSPPPGRFDPRHLLFAHAALTDVAAQAHWHGQRLGRWSGDPHVRPDHATLADTGVQLGGWSLARRDTANGPGTPRTASAPSSTYTARLSEEAFALELTLTTTQPLLLQGDGGASRKGPDPAQASFYYSQPQLAVAGAVRRGSRSDTVRGTAWLDHEWSETLLHPEAVGWDWVGMNLANGAALTAFQLRRADGSAVWAGGSWRPAGATQARVFGPAELVWAPLRWWASPASGARYPVGWRLRTPVGTFEVQALLNAQELDSRGSTGTVYWEGLSELRDAATAQRVGQGYLEMTGYAGRLQI